MPKEVNIKQASAFLIISRLKVIIKEELLDMGIPRQYINIDEILPYVPIRNILIRQEYDKRRKKGEKTGHIAMDMAEKYGVKEQTILNVAYNI